MRITTHSQKGDDRVVIKHEWWVIALTQAEAENLFDMLGMYLVGVTDEELDALLERNGE